MLGIACFGCVVALAIVATTAVDLYKLHYFGHAGACWAVFVAVLITLVSIVAAWDER